MTDLSGREFGGYRLVSVIGDLATQESASDLVLHDLSR
jgi:hypothetical protein